ncbi:MAG: Coenzyme F420 hydrogenase/dehydrogenase, beta subunit C-terminal domain [Chloroflexota bacterium]|nr:Coenzyme F420 hydrogenase/dehydrogenase, beta subunit C-terminal domain [Chloroflexota bacterium]MDE3193649.1 Coenzyme F420 hydrogenase/dehydrogenase, beta subunit C-terminal domain [Chloroflexota bacterium]
MAAMTRDAAVERVRTRYRDLLGSATDANEWPHAWRAEINRGGFRAVDFLADEIIDAGKCVGCGACVNVCPADVFDYDDQHPIAARTDACVLCVLCAEACPILRPPDKDLGDLVRYREPATDEGFGPYSYGIYARATGPEIKARGQDGGAVSALLVHALDTGTIKGAILGETLPGQRQLGRQRLATSAAEVLECSGSRYTYSPNTLAFREAMRNGVTPLALVGVPCQIDGLRLQQNSSIPHAMARWYRSNVALSIGLFCSESFTNESIQRLAASIETTPDQIKKMNIKGKVVVELDDGRVINASLKKYRQWARPACLYCIDYSAEHADIGMGGIGLDGWTFTLVRTEAGHRFLQAAIAAGAIETQPLDADPKGEMLLRKLSLEKKAGRPHPAKMPTLAERQALGHLDPKTFYTTGPGAAAKANGGASGDAS